MVSAAAAALANPLAVARDEQASPGVVWPRPAAPGFLMTGDDGSRFDFASKLRGRISAVQTIFVGCSGVCPIQGAVFAAITERSAVADLQLLSITVDPLGDSPQALQAWLRRFRAPTLWRAAVPRMQDVDALIAFLRGAPQRPGTHPAQVYLFDRSARLAYRSADMPGSAQLCSLLAQLAVA